MTRLTFRLFSAIMLAMLNEFINFETISRKEWQRLHKEDNAPLTAEELDSIRSLNDKIDVQEVSDIYLPLINLIRIYQKTANDLTFSKSIFLQNHRLIVHLLSGYLVLLLLANPQPVVCFNSCCSVPSPI